MKLKPVPDILGGPWTRQPPAGTPLDANHPLLRGLIWGVDYLARPLFGSAQAPTFRANYAVKAGVGGRAVEPDVATPGFTVPAPVTSLDEFTLVVVLQQGLPASPSSTNAILAAGSSGSSSTTGIQAESFSGGQNIYAAVYYSPDFSGAATLSASGAISNPGLYVIAQTYKRNSFHKLYVNGVLHTTGTAPGNFAANFSPSGDNVIYVNFVQQSAGVMAGWLQNVALDDADACELTQSAWRLFHRRPELVPGTGVQATPATAFQPNAFQSNAFQIYGADFSGGVSSISGAADIVFGAGSSTLTGAGALAGSAANVFGAGSSTLTGSGALAGSCALVFAAGSSTLTGSGSLAGTADNVFGAGSSTLTGAGALAGSCALVFGAGSSTLTGAGALAGSAALTFANSGTLDQPSGALAGAADLVFGAGSSTLTGAGALAGSADLVFGAGSSTLTGAGALAGSCALVFGAGSSTLTGSGSLTGSAANVFGAGSSTLTGSGALSGSAGITFANSGTLTPPPGALAGTAALSFGEGSSTLTGSGALLGNAALAFLASLRNDAASRDTGAGRSSRRRRQRYIVEIDGEEFEVSSPEQAEALLNEARELAEQRAKQVIERAQKATKRPKPKVLADAKKAMPAPEIRASAEIEPYALAVADEIRAIYRDAMRAVEMIALMRRADDDEEESLLLLLL